jgi:hypothetical protein
VVGLGSGAAQVSEPRPPTPDPREPRGAIDCPFCESVAVERVAQWGGQIITSQWRCLECSSYFEALREDFDDHAAARVTSSSEPK